MSGIALDPSGVEEAMCLPLIGGRELEACVFGEGKRNLLGASAITSLRDRTVKRLKLGDFRDGSRVPDIGDVVILDWVWIAEE